MKKIVATLLILIALTGAGQIEGTTVKFRHSHFNIEGQLSDVKEKSLQVSSILDLEFYKTNFHRPYHFPKQFIDSKYKSQSLIIWNDTTKKKSFESNWTFTYTYDSLSRVTGYDYSGCMVCSQSPYRIQITYDRQNRPLALKVKRALNSEEPPGEEYVFRYDDKGNITQVRFFRVGRLEEQIDRI